MDLFVYAVTLGVAFSAPPGAVTAQVLRRALRHGFWSGMLIQLGSLIGDAFWAVVALSGLSLLVQQPVIRLALGVLGGVLLLWLAWSALKDARHPRRLDAAPPSRRSDFMTGATVSLMNPWGFAFWLGIGSTLTAVGIQQPAPRDFVILMVGFLSGALLWALFFSTLLALGRRFITPTFFRVINALCAVGLGYFGLTLLWSVVRPP